MSGRITLHKADRLAGKYRNVLLDWKTVPIGQRPRWITESLKQMREELDEMYERGDMDEPKEKDRASKSLLAWLWGLFCRR